MTDEQALKAAISKWGEDGHLELMVEECSELIKAIQKLKRPGHREDKIKNFNEELADVEILINQLKLTRFYKKDLFQESLRFKMERVKQRLNDDNFSLEC